MSRQDLKSVLAQMQSFNIPGFDQMIGELKDPSLAPNALERSRAIAHNARLLTDRLQTMHNAFRVNPDEVTDYMTNKSHFSGPEWDTMEKVRRELGAYTDSLISDIEGDTFDESAALEAQKPKKPKKDKARSKLGGGRKGWIAS